MSNTATVADTTEFRRVMDAITDVINETPERTELGSDIIMTWRRDGFVVEVTVKSDTEAEVFLTHGNE